MRHVTARTLPARTTALAALLWLALLSVNTFAANHTVPLSDLARRTHFHGISVHPDAHSRIYLATHHGLFTVDARGLATRVSQGTDDFMGFTPHPVRREVLYASGHPARGGNLGFIASSDAGHTWRQLSPGLNGPVDFHQMDVSKADPDVIYGAFRELQVSRDGGKSWRATGPLPAELIDLAASAVHPDRIYAATRSGLLYSSDTGASWQPAHLRRSPTTLVQTGYEEDVYAFIVGVGLVRTREPGLRWELVNAGLGDRYLLHLAVDPNEPRRLYAVTNEPAVIESVDGGGQWVPLGAKTSQ